MRIIAALAYVPHGVIDDGFIKIMENSPDGDAISKFNDYMVEQWLENSNIGYI